MVVSQNSTKIKNAILTFEDGSIKVFEVGAKNMVGLFWGDLEVTGEPTAVSMLGAFYDAQTPKLKLTKKKAIDNFGEEIAKIIMDGASEIDLTKDIIKKIYNLLNKKDDSMVIMGKQKACDPTG